MTMKLDLDKVNKYCNKYECTNIDITDKYLTFEDDNTGEVFDVNISVFQSKVKRNYLSL